MENCPICLEDLAGRRTATTYCGHRFCDACLSEWMARAGRAPACPVCKLLLNFAVAQAPLEGGGGVVPAT